MAHRAQARRTCLCPTGAQSWGLGVLDKASSPTPSARHGFCFFMLEAGGWQRCAVASTHPGQERLHLSLSVSPTPRSSASPRGQLGAIALAYLLLLNHLLLPSQHLTSITRELILSPLPIYASQPQHTFFFSPRPWAGAGARMVTMAVVATCPPEELILLTGRWSVHSSPCLSAMPASAHPRKINFLCNYHPPCPRVCSSDRAFSHSLMAPGSSLGP